MTNVSKRKSQQNFKNILRQNKHTTSKYLWDAAKAVVRGKFIALHASIRKKERSQVDNLRFYFKKLGEKNKVTQVEGRE